MTQDRSVNLLEIPKNKTKQENRKETKKPHHLPVRRELLQFLSLWRLPYGKTQIAFPNANPASLELVSQAVNQLRIITIFLKAFKMKKCR